MRAEPCASFYRMIDEARMPQRADRSAVGTLPTRATRYCEAVTSASAFGWWLFPPIDVSFVWDGADIFWHYAGVSDWLPLETAQFPNFAKRFDNAAPEYAQGCASSLDGTAGAGGIPDLGRAYSPEARPDGACLFALPRLSSPRWICRL